MGKRSRKRLAEGDGTTRAERDARRRERAATGVTKGPAVATRPRPGRTSFEERPPPLWHPFPLTELLTLAGIVLMVWGFLSGPDGNGNAKIGAGLAVASIGGLELAVREHVTGFRSHTTLLAGALAVIVIIGLGLGAGVKAFAILIGAGAAVFAAAFWALRDLFRRRSGGLSFR